MIAEQVIDELSKLNGVEAVALGGSRASDNADKKSDYDVYVEKGSWSHEQTVALVAEAQNKVREDAIKSGVLQMATENGEKKLRQLFGCFGFNTVLIER